jgi:hypothetical protein
MPIHIRGAPSPDLHAIVARHLGNPLSAPQLSPAQRENAHATDAYPVYFLGLDDLEQADDTLSATSPRVWRHLLMHQGSAIAEADVRTDGTQARVVAVHQGPRGPGTARALITAQASALVKDADFEFRMLEAPGIRLVAVWLHSSRDDLLIAVEPDLSGLPRDRPIPLREALPVLRQRVAEVRAEQEGAAGPSGA